MITKQGQYVNKTNGEVVEFSFEIPADVQELKQVYTPAEVDKLALRMAITDARNETSAKTQAENGHNQKVMTEAQKVEAKQKRQADASLLAKIKALSLEDREALGL